MCRAKIEEVDGKKLLRFGIPTICKMEDELRKAVTYRTSPRNLKPSLSEAANLEGIRNPLRFDPSGAQLSSD